MAHWTLKDGLLEYSVKRLPADERRAALARINATLPELDPQLRRFLQMGNADLDVASPSG